MRRSTRHGTFRTPRLLASQAGFGLIEVMVSMVLLSALALTTFSIIDQSTANSAQGRSRAAAADLAHADLNRLRQLQFDTASNFTQVTNPAPIDGVPYQVTSTAVWTTDAGGAIGCTTPTKSGQPGAAYLRIASSVTWPAMGATKPVTADSLLVPRAKEIDRTAGSLIFSVQDSRGAPLAGVTVAAGGQSDVTNAAGCVFFPTISAGQITVTFARAGYVDVNGNSPGSKAVSIVSGLTSTATASFDRPVVFNPVKFVNDQDSLVHSWATGSAVSLEAGTVAYAASAPLTQSFSTGAVYPSPSGFSFYAGKCAGNNPATYTSDQLPNQSVIGAPGTTVPTAVAYMRPLTLSISGLNTTVSAQTVTYRITPYSDTTYSSMNGCAEAIVKQVAVQKNNTLPAITFDLPYGIYSVCVENGQTARTQNNLYQAYAYKSTTAPLNAFSNMPTVNGIALKSGAPQADVMPSSLVFTGPPTDQCP